MRAWTSFRSITPTNTRDRYIDDAFNYQRRRLFGNDTPTGNDITVPNANIRRHSEDEKTGFMIELAVPGYEKSDFEINLDDNVLTISAESCTNGADCSDEDYQTREYRYHTFNRSFRLPENVDEDKIVAAYRNGILAVFVPVNDAEETPRPRRIDVS